MPIAAYGHDFSDDRNTDDQYNLASSATCKEAAKYYVSCIRCWELDPSGETFYSGVPLEHIDEDNDYICDRADCRAILCSDHDLDNSGIHTRELTPATCTTEGLEQAYYICKYCGTEFNHSEAPIPKLGHSLSELRGAYQGEDGKWYNTYWCERCEEEWQSNVEHTNHRLLYDDSNVHEEWTNPTCEEDGSYYRYYICDDCGAVFDEGWDDAESDPTLKALGHDWGNWTYAIAESHYRVCNRCNAEETGNCTISWTTTKQPTCTEDGWQNGTCSVCGESYGQSIDASGHDTYHRDRSESTCVYAGYEAHDVCSNCLQWFQNGQIVAAEDITLPLSTEHAWNSTPTSETPATCTTDGSKTYECSLKNWGCKATRTEVLPAGHNYVGNYCSVCGDKKTNGTIGGCVFEGTQIALDADTSIDIADFVGGTPIDFCNPSTLEHAPQQTLTRFFYTKATKKVVLTLEDGKTIEVTPNHVVLTEEGFKTYLDNHDYLKYKVGDKLATVDGYKELVSIQEEEVPETTVYNIATENSLMVANGIIVAGELNYNTETIVLGGNTSKELN